MMENLENLILYIDDDITNLMLFKNSFSEDYKIITAESTKEAEELIQNNQFKVVLSDISVPVESGLDFFKRIHFDNFEPILIILTAHVSSSLLLEALHQGKIFRYLIKPFDRGELHYTIEQAINTFDLYYQNRMLYLQIKESELKFHNIFQYSQDAIIIFNNDEYILEANEAFLNIVEKDLAEIKSFRITDFLDEETKIDFSERITHR
jgi:DNA-binding NtrC family response regulator